MSIGIVSWPLLVMVVLLMIYPNAFEYTRLDLSIPAYCVVILELHLRLPVVLRVLVNALADLLNCDQPKFTCESGDRFGQQVRCFTGDEVTAARELAPTADMRILARNSPAGSFILQFQHWFVRGPQPVVQRNRRSQYRRRQQQRRPQ